MTLYIPNGKNIASKIGSNLRAKSHSLSYVVSRYRSYASLPRHSKNSRKSASSYSSTYVLSSTIVAFESAKQIGTVLRVNSNSEHFCIMKSVKLDILNDL